MDEKNASEERTGAITKDWKIGEIVGKYPEAAEILVAHGLHCVGCGVAHWETLEQGAKAHGMSDEEIDQIIREVNEFPPGGAVDEEPEEQQEDTGEEGE